MNKKHILIAALLSLGAPAVSIPAYAQSSTQAQTATVSGTVIDELGDPIVGATVRVRSDKASGTGTATDIDGKFTLRAPKDAVIEVTYIGYNRQTVSVKGRDSLVINLVPSAQALDEVVVTGYTTQKKESLTGAIAQIKGDEVYKGRGSTNTTVALQGEIPGLTVTRYSTRPGSENVSMQIRGAYSINGGSPLVLIDGQASSLDELNQIDGSNIANISVLKDASAAIYGARSAGGVILVTTKRGQTGKPQITYSGSYSRTINGIKMPVANNAEWLDMFVEAQYQDAAANNPTLTDHDEIYSRIGWWIFDSFGGMPIAKTADGSWQLTGEDKVYGEALVKRLRNGEKFFLQRGNYIDAWNGSNYFLDALYGNANSWKHNISISGGDEKFNYRASLNYSDAQSQLKIAKDGEKKYGAHLNADYKPNDFFKIETGMSYNMRDIDTPATGVGGGWFDFWVWEITNENGDPYDTFSGKRNPYGFMVDGGTIQTKWSTLRGNGKITLDFSKWVKGLTISGSAAYKNVSWDNTVQTLPVRFYDWVGTQMSLNNHPGGLSEGHKTWKSYTLGAFAQYNRKFFDKHQVDIMVGITGETEDYKRIFVSKNKGELYEGSGLIDLETTEGGDNNGAGGGQSSWSFLSYVADFRYAYNDTYLISFLGRRDGSSKLTPAQRWKNFYSISGGWVFTNEKFMRNLGIDNILNFGKLRYNYGKTGSLNGIGNYEAYSTIGAGTTYLGGSLEPTAWISGMTSNERTWETIKQHNAGIDLGFFNNRLRASFDWFEKNNEGMFINVIYPAVLGASAPKTNNGKLRTRGWEIELNWRDRIGEVNYNLGFQLSDAWTKLLELTNNENVPNPGYNSSRLIGKPLNAIYVYQTDGVFQTQEEVDAFYEMYYWNADHSGPKEGNVLPAPTTTGTYRLRPGARRRVDINGDGTITTEDIYYAGDSAPRLSFGIKAGIEWKGIDISAFFQGVWKQKYLRSGYLRAPFATNYTAQNNTYLGKTWTPENHSNEYTVMSRDNGFNSFNYDNSDISVQDNRYIRLKNLVVGYTLPRQWTSKAGIEKLRVYFSGDDLWEWTKVNDGYDPEYGEATNNTFPLCRLLNFGVELTF